MNPSTPKLDAADPCGEVIHLCLNRDRAVLQHVKNLAEVCHQDFETGYPLFEFDGLRRWKF